jgi:hypothetical protein
MSVDLSQASIKAAELIEQLAEILDADPGDTIIRESIEVGAVAMVVEVNYADTEGNTYCVLQWRCSEPRRWVQFGLFRRVADSIAQIGEPV